MEISGIQPVMKMQSATMAIHPDTVRNKTTLNTCVEDTALPLGAFDY